MKKYYFFKSVKEKDKIRVVPVEGQVADWGMIDPKKYCSCSKEYRESFPVGTIFYSESIKEGASKKYYCLGKKFRCFDKSIADLVKEYSELTKTTVDIEETLLQ